MSVYSVKGKGWRYDFTLKGQRYTEAWFKTKTEAKQAEAEKRKEVKNPKPVQEKKPTDMAFLDLVNLRLDHVKAYNSKKHYQDLVYRAKRWIRTWGRLGANEVSQQMVQNFLLIRYKVSPHTANMELRSLRALFNFGLKRKYVDSNPSNGIEFFPVEKRRKYVPPTQDIDKVIDVAEPEGQDYLWTIRETLGRMSEINNLEWEDVNFEARSVTLYTRKKKGGHLTPRNIPMTKKLYEVLHRRFLDRDESKPWVFWHRYWSKKAGQFVEGPYQDRKTLMKKLCEKAGVKYFRYHAIRHAGATLMDSNNVPIGMTQKILGHENRTTTEIYLHTLSDDAFKAMSIYEKAREKSHTDSHTK